MATLRPRQRNGPGAGSRAISKVTAGERGDSLTTIRHLADKAEKQRRERLARDLTRVADQLAHHHPAAAALARSWAGGADA